MERCRDRRDQVTVMQLLVTVLYDPPHDPLSYSMVWQRQYCTL